MITNIEGNMFDQPTSSVLHGCNCFNTFGSGVAKTIKEIYPEAYKADCSTISGDRTKLGKFTWAKCRDGKYIFNAYQQYDFGTNSRKTNYEAVYTAQESIRNFIKLDPSLNITSIAMPHLIGCDRGCAKWSIVYPMLVDIWEGSGINIFICKYTP